MDYNKSFINRAKTYMYAMNTYPDCLQEEFLTALSILDPQANETIINIPAGGVFIEKYINLDKIKYKSYETNLDFSNLSDISYCEYINIPEQNESIDKIIVLANLHHSNNEERIEIYNEMNRILKKNGKLIIGDVLKNSNQDRWLNIFVNEYNSNGHNGIFWNDPQINDSDKKLLEKCGFNITSKIVNYKWTFDSKDIMIDFCKNLFGLDKIKDNNDLYNGLQKFLNPVKIYNDRYEFDWKLIYFIATKI